MSLHEFKLVGAPPLQCRAVFSSITFAHIAGIPLQPGEESLPVAMQKLDVRVRKHFGAVPYVVLEPVLIPHPGGCFAAPKIERMAFLLAETEQESLVLVWFEKDEEVFMSEANRQRTAELAWRDYACPVAKT